MQSSSTKGTEPGARSRASGNCRAYLPGGPGASEPFLGSEVQIRREGSASSPNQTGELTYPGPWTTESNCFPEYRFGVQRVVGTMAGSCGRVTIKIETTSLLNILIGCSGQHSPRIIRNRGSALNTEALSREAVPPPLSGLRVVPGEPPGKSLCLRIRFNVQLRVQHRLELPIASQSCGSAP
jgi:hypothetical protein